MNTNQLAMTRTSAGAMRRIADFVELTKPRIAVMVLITVAAGGLLASQGLPSGLAILHAVIGTALVAGGASVLNQVIEKETDALMPRTANRPLPAGRISVFEAQVFGAVLGIAGAAYLAWTTNARTCLVAIASFVLYVWVYTPLKAKTTINTIIGAIPGALPPVIGWAAVANDLSSGAWMLFLVVYLWQFPHFLAIAWIYRHDYCAGGLKMLPTSELGCRLTGVQALSYCLVLLPISLLPFQWGTASQPYLWSALLMGLQYLGFSVWFLTAMTDANARRLLYSSLLYLPVVLGVLMFDHLKG